MSDTEFARRGDEIYAREVRPRITPNDSEKFVAIDLETEDFEIDVDARAAMDRLAARRPDVEAWLTRIGRDYAHRFGRGEQHP